MKKFGNTYKWCSKCNLWIYHRAAEHDAWAARREKRLKEEKEGKGAAAKMAVVPDSDDDDDDFIKVFGGLTPSRY